MRDQGVKRTERRTGNEEGETLGKESLGERSFEGKNDDHLSSVLGILVYVRKQKTSER